MPAMNQSELDQLCIQWRHEQRRPAHCANPMCPGRPLEVEDGTAELAEAPDVTDELQQVPDSLAPAKPREQSS